MKQTTRRVIGEALPKIKFGPDSEDTCELCPHNWGDHIVMAENPLRGGTWKCPECDCNGTWDIPQMRQLN